MRAAWLALLLVALPGCRKDDSRPAASEAIDREVDHATNLVLAACKPDRDGATSLRATTVASAFSLALGVEAACAGSAKCKAPAPSREREASVRELPPESRRVLDDATAAIERALTTSSGDGRARLEQALSTSRVALEQALSLAKLCGNPARISEVPEAMSKVNAARAASRAATKGLREGG